MNRTITLLAALLVLLNTTTGFAQYNSVVGRSAPMTSEVVEIRDEETGVVRERRVVKTKPAEAGTKRYVKNAAAWLANYERFGDDVVGARHLEERKTVPTQGSAVTLGVVD